jgi:urease accessory protein
VAAVALQGFATTLVQAAQRLIPSGQTAAQRVILHIALVCDVVGEATTLSPNDIGSCAFALDIASMHREALDPRLFRS